MTNPAATILIVDDEIQNRKLLEALLRPEGYLTLFAANGEEALASIAQRAPDLILLDVMMPGMDGYHVAGVLKANPATANIPIIMVTALVDRSARLAGLNVGAEEFLTKPVDRAELSLRVRNLLRLKAYGDCLMRDITKLKQNERQLEKLAFHDSLTGLPNRTLFKDRLHVALESAARQKSLLGVIYLDLDRFKYVNDTLGHAAGDSLLVEISQRINSCLRSSDTLVRMGGDEFTILLPHLGAEADVVQIAERIIQAVGEAVHLDDESVYVGASIGISYFPKDGRDAETMQKNADLAMYEAKEGGRGQYRVFSPEMVARGNQRRHTSRWST